MGKLFSDMNIGDVFAIKVIVVEDKDNRGCQDCAFIDFDCSFISCSCVERPDLKSVFYKEIKD